MPDSNVSGKPAQGVFVENMRNESHPGVQPCTASIGCGDTTALLATVLKGKQGKKREPGHVLVRGVDPENTARFVQAQLSNASALRQ